MAAPTAPVSPADPLLRVRGLRTYFESDGRVFKAVDGVDLDVFAGESVGVVGESGCGKTAMAMSLLRLIPTPPGRIVGGSVHFEQTDLVTAGEDELRRLRGNRIAYIFQDPMTSLNPVLPVGAQLVEVMRAHRPIDRAAARSRAIELLDAVRIPAAPSRLRQFPHELSGGMRQRVGIAMALANDPALLIADEPTTALDVTVQAEIIALLAELRETRGMSMLFITHDFGVVTELCDRVIVMYAGRVVEESPIDTVFAQPRHPYTRRLIGCVPRLGETTGQLDAIPGMPPALDDLPVGCAFAPRCDVVEDRCRRAAVDLTAVGPRQRARCVKAEEST
jgi:peptide/nickel transport system permease protein